MFYDFSYFEILEDGDKYKTRFFTVLYYYFIFYYFFNLI